MLIYKFLLITISNLFQEGDKFLSFMKNTDEARKVIKKNGPMFWAVYERVNPKINSIKDLIKALS